MRKILCVFLAVAFLPMLACSGTQTVKKPVGPASDKTDMPWNRPMGPEGAGALGILGGS